MDFRTITVSAMRGMGGRLSLGQGGGALASSLAGKLSRKQQCEGSVEGGQLRATPTVGIW